MGRHVNARIASASHFRVINVGLELLVSCDSVKEIIDAGQEEEL